MSNTSENIQATLQQALDLGLNKEEFGKMKNILGRNPNFTELSISSVMWSEHCSYKNSIKWLKTLPRDGDQMLVKAGEENAGLVDLGDDLACAFKIESHNHPSAIEPYQGAATGVGGINRDIFTMGARPIAQLNSLRFGSPDHHNTRNLIKGVVRGIGDYGNSFGVPVVGGEVYFDESYNINPLVNAFSAGIMKKDRFISAISKGVGNSVFIVGSSTGKDGIHGAAFASKDITDDSADDLPAVQVGDPFQEKLLLEASMELSKHNYIIGMQDMGAAGIVCSSSEMSAAGNCGMKINLDLVPKRQNDMKDWEILLSESQERMLVVVKKGHEDNVKDIFDKWDLNCVQIGEVTGDGILQYFMNNKLVAEIPADVLVLGGGAPVYERDYKEPDYFKDLQKFNIDFIEEPTNYKEISEKLTSSLNLCSRNWVYNQYDSMVGTINMSTNSPSDSAIVNLKGTEKSLFMTVDCNSKYVHADPKIGAMIAVSEAARNIVCSGGKPLAITNCLNFGNPYNPEVYWQFVNVIKGMKEACEKFNTPVTGGNVSFYNQTASNNSEVPVFPTPTIGMIGLGDKRNIMSLDFKGKSDLIYLIGETRNDIGSSEYLQSSHNIRLSSVPYFNLEEEYMVQTIVSDLIKNNLIQSAHDISEGGLFINLLESSMSLNLGFDITTSSELRKDAFLFGESQSRIVVSVSEIHEDKFLDFMKKNNSNFSLLGHVTKGEIRIDDEVFGDIDKYKSIYNTSFSKFIDS